MTPTVDDLREQLRVSVKMRRQSARVPPNARFYGNEDLVLQHGTEFQRAPVKIIGGLPRQCYANSYRFATRGKGKWVYCEGFALLADLGLAVPHAWVLRADDPTVAHDPTWEDGDAVYMGVPFQESYIRKVWKASRRDGDFAVLDCWQRRWPLLTGKHKIEDVIWRPGNISPQSI